jgi:cytoskeleton-associated protein 5
LPDLKNVFQTTLTDILPDLDAALKSKNPQVKEGTLKFLARAIASATVPIQPAQVKPLAETLATLLEDGFEGARNEAATTFGTLMKMVGERPLNATMETLPDLRKAKIKEAFEKATIKCKAGGPAPSKPAPAAAPAKKPPTAAKPPPTAVLQEVESPPAKKPPTVAKPPAKLLVSSLLTRLSIHLSPHIIPYRPRNLRLLLLLPSQVRPKRQLR